MKERLKKLRLTLGYNLQEISEKLNIPANTYIGYEYRTKNVPLEFLTELVKSFNVNINWLLTGEGDMFSVLTKKSADSAIHSKKYINIGKHLDEIQQKNNYPDKEMAKILGIYEYEYVDLKQGFKEPTLKILDILKSFFQISIDWFLYGD